MGAFDSGFDSGFEDGGVTPTTTRVIRSPRYRVTRRAVVSLLLRMFRA